MSVFAVVTFQDPEKLDDGIDKLKALHADGSIKFYSSAIVARDPDGKLSVRKVPAEGLGMTAVGALIGGLAGLPLGPAATILGAASGAVIGEAAEMVNEGDEGRLLGAVARDFPPGSTVIVAELDQEDATSLAFAMARVGGEVTLKEQNQNNRTGR